ncbi:spore germination protein [Natronincola ferrireducens]|uniref:Stage V sporulation protein AF n=1 Tax=Natronincola ferrireducens TaxID=393762 RepID=A0A1G9D6Q7_9FIRM|nr:spore germination protein [Natronincola ferrireducens]SDK59531.1 stage V sporulation protein AF [Natronincola ferrireducens]
MKIAQKLKENKQIFTDNLGIGQSFDIVDREIKVANKDALMLFIDGFAKDDVMVWIMGTLQNLKKEDIAINTLEKLIKSKIAYLEVETEDEVETIQDWILSGALALLIDGEKEAIIIDVREYPIRGPEEPDLERVTRGSRDGFVETIIFNTALIRRRIRDPKLCFEITKVGTRSKSDIVIGYIKDIANKDLVEKLKNQIDEINIDALTMAEKSLQEFILGGGWNPFPKAKFTERPDVAAAHLLEGHIIIIVDTSPSVMILPVTIFHFTQHAEDYYQAPSVGTYIRWVRLLGIFFSFVLPPLWLLGVFYNQKLPEAIQFIGPKEDANIPLYIQFLILEIGLDMLRIASIHTPNTLSTSLGIIGALLLSEFAVDVGWFVPETVLYMAVAGIGMFATPSIEFSYAVRLFRLLLIILTGVGKIYGFVIGILIMLITLFSTKGYGDTKYLWPLIPFDGKALRTILFRQPIPDVSSRPAFLRTKDKHDK